MLRKVSGLLILGAMLLSIISPVNLAFIHLAGKNNVLVTFDVCHESSLFRATNADVPAYPEQIYCCLSVPGFAGLSTTLRPLFKASLLAFPKEIPPRA